MNISNYEKKRRKHEKELKSFRNKMGSNIVWFDSLSKTKQYDLLFGWKKIKFRNTITKPEYRKVTKRIPIDPQRPWGRKKLVQVMELKYPPSLKHFIKECRESRLYKPMIQNLRQTTIDIILNEK
jgi:hypothetical protein